MPWKNGGGVTCEVAAWPPGTGSGGFDWRISIASVTRSGPFSVFPGVDRALAVLKGTLRLSIEGREELLLQPGTPPVHFPGDVPCEAEPQGMAVTDLNVMTRRGRLTSRLTWIAVERQRALTASAQHSFVLVLDSLTLVSRGLAYQLHPQDLAELEPEDGAIELVAHTARCIFIELSAA